MGIYILYLLLLLIPVLWIVSVFIQRKWKHILVYTILNALLIAIYFYIIFYSNYKIFLHDEYRLKKIFLFLYIIMTHTIAGFIFAMVYKYKVAKNQKTIL